MTPQELKDFIRQELSAFTQVNDNKLAQLLEGATRTGVGTEPKLPKGTLFARACMIEAAASRRNIKDPVKHFEHLYGEQFIRQMASGIVSADDLVSGGAWIVPQMSTEFIEALHAENPLIGAGARTLEVPGKVQVPELSSGTPVTWVGPGTDDSVSGTRANFGTRQMIEHEVSTVTGIPNQWLEMAITGADQMINQDMISSAGEAVGDAYINGLGTQKKPQGLLSRSGTHITANGTANVANCAKDLGKMRSAVRKGLKRPLRKPTYILPIDLAEYLRNLPNTNGGWAFRDAMERGILNNTPYIETSLIAEGANTFALFIEADGVIIGIERIKVEAFREGTVSDGAGGMITAVGQNLTLIRLNMTGVEIITRHDKAVADLNTIAWAV